VSTASTDDAPAPFAGGRGASSADHPPAAAQGGHGASPADDAPAASGAVGGGTARPEGDDANDGADGNTVGSASDPEAASARPRTVLVASDVPFLRAEVAAVIDDGRTRVLEAASGPEVLAVVAEESCDVAVLDLQMDVMGGIAICYELRLEESYGRLPHVAVLLLLDRRADVFLARRAGAEGWIVKPIDPIRLRRAIDALARGGTFYDQSYAPVPLFVGVPAR
jgi:CheY-like chemotaxis protein